MNTCANKKIRVRTVLFTALAAIAMLPFFCLGTKAYAAAHNTYNAEKVNISTSWVNLTGTTSGCDEGGININDYYKFTTDNTPGVTYIFESINVSAENTKNLWCRLQDAEGNDIYSQQDGIHNDFSYNYGASKKTSSYQLEKNKTYYISVQAYPTPGKIHYRMRVKLQYDKPAKAVLKSLKSKKKKTLTVQWKSADNADQYEVAYKAKGGKWKYLTVSGKTIKIRKLKSKKKYYVKVRAVRNAGGMTLYGSWSSTKKVKVK